MLAQNAVSMPCHRPVLAGSAPGDPGTQRLICCFLNPSTLPARSREPPMLSHSRLAYREPHPFQTRARPVADHSFAGCSMRSHIVVLRWSRPQASKAETPVLLPWRDIQGRSYSPTVRAETEP